MALTYVYPDAYLSKFCTEEREDRAIEEVTLLAGDRTFSADWTEKLVIIQTYILACLEHQADAEDLFTAKLKNYREEMALQLPRAQADADSTAGSVASPYSFPVERA
jgi:hypothetical protein